MTQSTRQIVLIWSGVAALLVSVSTATHLALPAFKASRAQDQSATEQIELHGSIAGKELPQRDSGKDDRIASAVESLRASSTPVAPREIDIVPAINDFERQLPKPVATVIKSIRASVATSPESEDESPLLDIDADIMATMSLPTADPADGDGLRDHPRINDIVQGRAVESRGSVAHEIGNSLKGAPGTGGLLN